MGGARHLTDLTFLHEFKSRLKPGGDYPAKLNPSHLPCLTMLPRIESIRWTVLHEPHSGPSEATSWYVKPERPRSSGKPVTTCGNRSSKMNSNSV
jgi:hypothetical protein